MSLINSIIITATGMAKSKPQKPPNSKPTKIAKIITIGERPTIFLIIKGAKRKASN